MNRLSPDRFGEYFEAVHGHVPYDWQQRLAERAAAGDWPAVIDLPTGSGKTACLDVAVFALACQAIRPIAERTAPRRIFFCVNRRVIVDEAYDRAMRIAQHIAAASDGVLAAVAAALRTVAGDTLADHSPPLDVLALRGGICRDNRWARSATQPTIVTATVDQLGSRLLFRGYGVSAGAAPIQAALAAYDSLVLLDEAHISRPFQQTLEAVRGYLSVDRWVDGGAHLPAMQLVPMTATPPEKVVDVIRLTAADRDNPRLAQRLTASKPARLIEVRDVAKEATRLALAAAKAGPKAIGIIVNRVATAKAIYRAVSEKCHGKNDTTFELVIGSMRPVDRDAQSLRLRTKIGSERPAVSTQTTIVIATQCLEVGADYDFDALLTECASLDALRQRFGRLNRAGRAIEADAAILIAAKQVKAEEKLDDQKPDDPVYGNALARTWNWLDKHAVDRCVDFGIDAFGKVLEENGGGGGPPTSLLSPSSQIDAPCMLPTYLDFWRQTAPRPTPDPDVSLFLHGPDRGPQDVCICWRADLVEKPGTWVETVALVPPTSAECMTIGIDRIRRWLISAEEPKDAVESDLLETPRQENELPRRHELRSTAVLWRGRKNSSLLMRVSELRPGDTVVLPTAAGGWEELGHIPGEVNAVSADSAESAFSLAADRALLRLHPSLRSAWCDGEDHSPRSNAFVELFAAAALRDDPTTSGQWRQLLLNAANTLTKGDPRRSMLTALTTARFRIEDYNKRSWSGPQIGLSPRPVSVVPAST